MLHEQLVASIKNIYEPSGLTVTSPPAEEPEGAAYGACRFALNDRPICFRVAKITPTKNGQFVTLWKRPESGVITPFDAADPIDFFVVVTVDGEHSGQFIFSKDVLIAQGIVSRGGKSGKLAMRVYPPWVKTESKQAAATQQWQIKYFLACPPKPPLGVGWDASSGVRREVVCLLFGVVK